MITLSTVKRRAPRRPPGTRLLASIDVEWTKNYRIPNGNVPFCYSITWLSVPATGDVQLSDLPVEFLSRYVHSSDETPQLVAAAATDIAAALDRADVVVGHQLSSDLSVLAAAAALHATPADSAHALQQARAAWHERRTGARRALVVDTRYDAGHVLTGTSRRLVDVCTELQLDVTQPELRNTSMTAVHRRWLDGDDDQAREKITVLNLRHGLSAALVALRASGQAPPQAVPVNRMLLDILPPSISWLQHPTFTALLDQPLHQPSGSPPGTAGPAPVDTRPTTRG